MFVFTFVAGLFTFQYDKPHFDPLPRLPPNRARTHTDSPVMSRSSFVMSEILSQFFCLCRMCLPFPSSWKILVIPDTSEGKPSEPPFLLRGSISPFPLAAYAAATGGLQERLATMCVLTLVAGLCTYQTDKTHLDRSHGRHRTGQLQQSYC